MQTRAKINNNKLKSLFRTEGHFSFMDEFVCVVVSRGFFPLTNWSVNQIPDKLHPSEREKPPNEQRRGRICDNAVVSSACFVSPSISALSFAASSRSQKETISSAEWFTLLILLPPLCAPPLPQQLISHCSHRSQRMFPSAKRLPADLPGVSAVSPHPLYSSLSLSHVLFGAFVFPRHNSGCLSPK